MLASSRSQLLNASGSAARTAIRAGLWRHPTAGVAEGYVQANLVVLPGAVADSFREFCARNPRPCPLLEMPEPRSAEPKVAFLLGCSFTFEPALASRDTTSTSRAGL